MRFILIFLMLSGSLTVCGQKKWRQLEAGLLAAVQGFKGDIGYYVEDLSTGKAILLNADTVFPTASIVKVPILAGIMDKIKRGELDYHQKLVYKDSLLYEGEDVLGSFKHGEKIELSKVMMLMLTLSDNTASLWLQSLAGGGTRINEIMDSAGLVHTRVNSRTPGREDARGRYGWGQTTPREMARLFALIYRGQLLDEASSARMLKLLGRNHWDEEALVAIPAGVFTASKNGAVNRSRSEVLLVLGKRPYLFSIFTKNNEDQSWENHNEAWELTRKMSALVWAYFASFK